MRGVDDIRFGQVVRRIRTPLELRQSDLAGKCRVSSTTISRLERGHASTLSLDTVRRIGAALEVRVDLVPRWRGGDLDRLLNGRHSALNEAVAWHLAGCVGGSFQPEVSFAFYADRGVVDILAFHRARGALLVVELKTEIVDVNELVATLDRKVRVARRIARERGWLAEDERVAVSAWVVVRRAGRIG